MQKDGELFDRCQITGTNFMRFYSWQDYAVSLGYRQEKIIFPKTVKRITGGGAVLHCPGELTYSLGICGDFRQRLGISQACSQISGLIVQTLRDLGLAVYDQQNCRAERFSDKICFAQTAPYEIKIDDKKLVGSAQKMTKLALFQHGSIGINRPKQSLLVKTDFANLLTKQAFLADYLTITYQELSILLANIFQKSLLKMLS